MAAIASRRQRALVIVGMALAASHSGLVRPGQRESRCRVIERGGCPVRRRMADRAILREIRRNVVRDAGNTRRAGPLRDVAVVAGCRSKRIVVADVAGNAGPPNVRPRQSKSRRAMVPSRGRELRDRRGVAVGAVRGGKG